jgi:hypothetical protein
MPPSLRVMVPSREAWTPSLAVVVPVAISAGQFWGQFPSQVPTPGESIVRA